MCCPNRCPYVNVRCCACSAGWIGFLFGLIGLITVCVLVGKFKPPIRDEIPIINYEEDQQEGNYAFAIVEGALAILANALLLIGIWKKKLILVFIYLVFGCVIYTSYVVISFFVLYSGWINLVALAIYLVLHGWMLITVFVYYVVAEGESKK